MPHLRLSLARLQAYTSGLLFMRLHLACAVLGTLQYRWIGEASRAERASLQQGLRESLQRIGQEFDGQIARSIAALQPSTAEAEDGSDAAYAARYMNWKQTGQHNGIFRRIAVARPQGSLHRASRPRAGGPARGASRHQIDRVRGLTRAGERERRERLRRRQPRRAPTRRQPRATAPPAGTSPRAQPRR